MYITINKLREHNPNANILEFLRITYADDAPINISAIFASHGLDVALHCLRAVEGYDKEIRLYAVWCARQVQHLMPDARSLAALDVAERHAYGRASDAEDAAWEAAWSAAWEAAGAAAGAAARAAALAAAREAARTAAGAAWVAARNAQAAKLCEVCELIEATHEHKD
jgi:hypothetical protein